MINDPAHIERAEIIRDKGTDRQKFFRGHVDKYSWVDIGSSFGPSEILSAILLAQLEEAEAITARRRAAWDRYHALLRDMEETGRLRRPVMPEGTEHNAHIYYVLMPRRAADPCAQAVRRARDRRHLPLLPTSRGGSRTPLWQGFGIACKNGGVGRATDQASDVRRYHPR